MADWTAIPDSVLDPDAPLTSDLAYAWRDNPIAIAEGASGAPYQDHIWHPFDSTSVGDSTGEIWSFAADGAVTEVETPDFEDGWEYRIRMDAVSHNGGGSRTVSVSVYRETSASYSAAATILTLAATGVLGYGTVEFLRPRGVVHAHMMNCQVAASAADSAVVAGTNSALQITHTTAQKLLRAKLVLSGPSASIVSGVVYLERRKIYA